MIGRGDHSVVGQVQVFAAMAPIIAGQEQHLVDYLHSLPEVSPFAQVSGTHFARWVVIPRLPYEGPPQRPDTLRSLYLFFSACFDRTDIDVYLDRLTSGLGSTADEVWGHCVGYGGSFDLARYLRHNQTSPSAVFAQRPNASVTDVKAALDLRSRLLRFVMDHQAPTSADVLRREWTATFGAAGSAE